MPDPDSEPLIQSFHRLKDLLEAYSEREPLTTTAEALLEGLKPFDQLGRQFQLSAFEQLVLLLTVALELEPNFQAHCAKAQGDAAKPCATLGLALSCLPGADWSVLSPQNPLHYWQLIHIETGRWLTQASLRVDRRILCYVLGEPALATELTDMVTPFSALGLSTELLPSHQAIVQGMVAAWTGRANQPLPLITLTGIDATTHGRIAKAACDRMGFHLMTLPATLLPTDAQGLKHLQRLWEREAILTNSVLLLESDGVAAAEPGRQTALTLFLETLTTPVLLSTRDNTPPWRRSAISMEVPPLTHSEQITLWRTCLGETAADLDGYVEVLASQFKLPPQTIQTVCGQVASPLGAPARPSAVALSLPSSTEVALGDRLWHLCRVQARPNLDDLAQRIDPTATWEDLVLPERQRQVLGDMAAQLNHRARVYQAWGFAHTSSRSLGISALFYGESGTGKTMAAEVLAQACRLDLYRIDLSMVVSKYIGETEKNLRRIFDAAEVGSVILLFDEADALFGKRTEVKDSHDRHANIEVSYLLQRMESYQGLAILTTNLKANLDQAFLRRLRFIVPFPFPDEPARANIWRGIFPPQAPTRGLNYERLSQLKIPGGNVRNIALGAAFLAAQANEPITMGHIRQAAHQEYQKLERLLTAEELKDWE